MQADVAVVGAGPAGSVAAQRLAAVGVRVVLLERATFPRDKPCGDGVSGRGLSVPRLLNRVFRRLRRDKELALLVGHIIIGHKSPRLALRPTTLLRLLA